MNDSERELVQRASRGDSGAVDDLLRKYLPDLRNYVQRQAGPVVRGRESSSDLVQSVCRELLENLADGRFEYRGEPEFRAWLRAAALNKVRHRGRYWEAARRAAGREVAGGQPGLEEGPAVHSHTPSREVAQREAAERARRLFESLPERYRQVIQLARIEGLGHREIAARMGLSEPASRMLLSRALARLATLGEQERD